MAREWNSKAYHRLSDPQLGWAMKVIERLDSVKVPRNALILDAGCGTSRVTTELLRRFPDARVSAVDASENMAREAKITLVEFGDRVTVSHADLLDLTDCEHFDVVFSTAVFHWIKDHDRLFAVLFRALKSGGLLMAQCGGGPNLQRVRHRVQLLMDSSRFSQYFAGWDRVWEYPGPELTMERLRRAGFLEVCSWLEPAPQHLSGEAHYSEFLKNVILHPYLERLPAEKQEEFAMQVVRQAAQDDPPFLLDYWRLNLQGRKAA